jgi:hypothetical protein
MVHHEGHGFGCAHHTGSDHEGTLTMRILPELRALPVLRGEMRFWYETPSKPNGENSRKARKDRKEEK